MSTAIQVQALSKSYMIGHQHKWRYLTLRDVISSKLRALGNGGRADAPTETKEEFWALKDVSFEVGHGDRIGVIGRNGAGKSTLLKVLSRITEPSSGRVEIEGRVASLLEVGTGFHPELTGRENVFLNGAVLGMSRAEIRARFDEIVAFAEVEKFLDTPVKRYSSGMYVRLAFSVAAHLECDILIVDEILSVGDAEFQKRCLGKLEGLTGAGRTVIFVSHNMEIIQRVCNLALFLEKGAVRLFDRDVRHVVNAYLDRLRESTADSVWENNDKQMDNPWFVPSRMSLTSGSGHTLQLPARNDAEMWINIEGDIATPDPALQVGYGIFDQNGTLLFVSTHTDGKESSWGHPKVGMNTFRSRIPSHLLNEGNYRIELLVGLYWGHWIVRPGVNAPGVRLEIQGGLSESPQWTTPRQGILAPIMDWQLR